MPGHFIFQQDSVPAHATHRTSNWLSLYCPDFINKDECPSNLPNLNPFYLCVWGAMLQIYQRYAPKPTRTNKLEMILGEYGTICPYSLSKRPFYLSERVCSYISRLTVVT